MSDTKQTQSPAKEGEEKPQTPPVEKYPELAKMKEGLEKERQKILAKSAPLRKQREELLSKIHPYEDKLREVNKAIEDVERPRLGEIDSQLGRLAVAMGGRAMNQPEGK